MTKVGCLVVAVAVAGGCASKTPPPAAAAAPPPASGAALNSPASPASPTPPVARTAEAIFADSVQATGGAAAWNAHKTLRAKIETVFQGLGLGGTSERVATSAGKALTVTEMTGVGTTREGTNGQVSWSQDPILGFRILEGGEAEQARIDSSWNVEMQAKELFAKLESTTEKGSDGAPLDCVVATPKVAHPVQYCYDAKTHLQVSQKGLRVTPHGDLPYHTVSRDWREQGGLTIAFESEAQVGPVTLITKIKSVTFDEPVDDKIFEPPVPKVPKAAKKPAARP